MLGEEGLVENVVSERTVRCHVAIQAKSERGDSTIKESYTHMPLLRQYSRSSRSGSLGWRSIWLTAGTTPVAATTEMFQR
jgi:hypothetical protein